MIGTTQKLPTCQIRNSERFTVLHLALFVTREANQDNLINIKQKHFSFQMK